MSNLSVSVAAATSDMDQRWELAQDAYVEMLGDLGPVDTLAFIAALKSFAAGESPDVITSLDDYDLKTVAAMAALAYDEAMMRMYAKMSG